MRKVLAMAFAILFVSFVGSARAACTGDCGGDGEVTVDEITKMVNIALGTLPASSCTAADANGDNEVTVDEIVAAVGFALNSCPAAGGALGTRRFTINPRTSPFTAVLSPGFSLPLGGGFKGQTNGVVENGFLELKAGAPDPTTGVASLDVTGGSEYLFVDARPTANLVLCLKPILPITNAGVVLCNGGPDVSIAINANHHLGQVGLNGYTAKDCLSDCSSTSGGCGSLESPNQICAAGIVGDQCRANADCNNTGATDGVCGLGRLCLAGKRGDSCTSNSDCDMGGTSGVCSPQPKCTAGKTGTNCRADGECDTAADAFDGVCGNVDAHPGVCNSPISFGQTGLASDPGSVSIAPLAEFGLKGLPAVLSIESATPCGDEGGGLSTPFALTSSLVRATIDNFSNAFGVCSKGKEGADCTTDADCNSTATDGVCGDRLIYESRGQAFSCQNWTQADGPGCLSLAVPAIDTNPMGGDLVTSFKFCGK